MTQRTIEDVFGVAPIETPDPIGSAYAVYCGPGQLADDGSGVYMTSATCVLVRRPNEGPTARVGLSAEDALALLEWLKAHEEQLIVAAQVRAR